MTKAKKKILIVDDEYYLTETLKLRLEFLGYEVLTAENGAESLEVLKANPVDLVVMDVLMPVMDGLEATAKIKKTDKTKKIPVLVLTAKAQPKDKAEAFAAGADDYLTKPFETDVFVSKVKKWTGT
ncbi:MAG: response regulator [Deltaproteobacteria bacterium]|nr:response regulator [Deltaproteobacteria bacterium]